MSPKVEVPQKPSLHRWVCGGVRGGTVLHHAMSRAACKPNGSDDAGLEPGLHGRAPAEQQKQLRREAPRAP